MRNGSLLLFFVILVSCHSNKIKNSNKKNLDGRSKLELSLQVATQGNSWVMNSIESNKEIITAHGIQNWHHTGTKIRTYFKTEVTGNLNLGLNVKAPNGKSSIKVTVGTQSKEIELENNMTGKIEVGVFKLSRKGYHFVEIQGLKSASNHFPNIDALWLGGAATKGKTTYVKDDYYWGRRGPSVHLTYETPENKDILWFYNEIKVPKGEDTLGSYFMANGFAEGYFGIQVNSKSERRILFSVWSPYKTQDPNKIPEGYKIKLLAKGKGVTTGEFGNEGLGGQSYKVFDWKAGNTYKFLLKGVPSKNNSTDYTAYFYAPEEEEWHLIASFRRPHTSTYLTRPHSFLENFLTETGYISRKGLYGNQ